MSKELSGRVVAGLTGSFPESIAIHFTDGTTLAVEHGARGIRVIVKAAKRAPAAKGMPPRPTHRQSEYLEFIRKYMNRYGTAPAESDIQRHFLLTAPSVNQMVRNLERGGFIVRDRDSSGKTVPRSIRLIWDG